MSATEDFDFDVASSAGGGDGPTEPDYYAATLRAIQKPKPSERANDQGEYPLTSIFEWELDEFPGEYRKWSYINVQARGEKSNFNKMHMACFGKPVPKGAFPSKSLLGARCKLNIAGSESDPTKLVVRGYVPLRRSEAARTAPTPKPAPAPAKRAVEEEPLFTDEADATDDLPF